MNNDKNEATIQDVLEAVEIYSNKVEDKFEKIEGKFGKVETEIAEVKKEMIATRSVMVTKDYLDDKIAELRGEIMLTMRGEDKKVLALVDILKEKKILNEDEVTRILTMKPFPQLVRI